MNNRLLNHPALRVPASGIVAVAGLCLAYPARLLVLVVSMALWLVAVLILRLLRPFVVTLLLLAIVGGIGAGLVFAYSHHWQDAMQATLITILCAVVFIAYCTLLSVVDEDHFKSNVPTWWWFC